MKVTITGGTGFLGRSLRHALTEAGHEVRITSRSAPGAVRWDPGREPLPAEAYDGVDALVHLVGEPLLGRWNADKKQRVWDSRVLGTRRLVEGLRQGRGPLPKVLVSGSAIGYYGDTGDAPVSESASPGEGFLCDLGVEWEAEAHKAEELGVRVAALRTGLVLDPSEGLLKTMLLPFKLGLGGRLGHGRQWMSWIHRHDWVGIARWCLESDVRGPVNAVAPDAVQNREFTQTLAAVLRRPAVFPVPAWAMRLALGEMGDNALESQRVEPRAATHGGYAFRFPLLRQALEDLL